MAKSWSVCVLQLSGMKAYLCIWICTLGKYYYVITLYCIIQNSDATHLLKETKKIKGYYIAIFGSSYNFDVHQAGV